MRWTGQWPQHASTDFTQETITDADEQLDPQRPLSNQLMAIDHQLHQQLQTQLCVEQFQLLNQLQVGVTDRRPLLHSSFLFRSLISFPSFSLFFTIQNQQAGTISLIPNASLDGDNLTQTAKISVSTQPGQLQLPVSSVNANNTDATGDQTQLVFNVDPEKSSSLQLLFQLPNVQGNQLQQAQQPQQLPPLAVAPNKPSSTTSSQSVGTQLNASNLLTNSSGPTLKLTYGHQAPVCSQHSQQVQVSTQTPQQQVSALKVPLTATSHQPTALPESTSTHTSQPQPQTQPQPAVKTVIGGKKSTDKTRKERKTVMRQAPAGSQANTTQQPTTGSTTAANKTIDVDSETDSNHDTALTLACAGGHEELVELLLTRGASIEHRDKKGFTPLILAATAGHEKVVHALINHGAEVEAQSERTKDTPLSLACSGGRYEVVELLLGMGANKEHRNVSDYTPLSLAASGGYVNIIRLLLNHGAEINSRTGSKLGISPLMLAAMNGHTAAVKMLLDMGSDINAQIETNRNTALTLACFQGRHEVVSLLLDRKANVEHRAKTGLTPLMEAASGGYIEVGRVLLDKGADVNAAPVPSSRDTALTIAADKGHLKFVDLLLSRGAAVEVKNKKGNSPLWLAANGGHIPVVKILKNHDADIDSQDNRRVSCLMAAFRKGHIKVVEWMVNHVTQFPSDQEMTRYISTVSDKELGDKCRECVKIIRAAKEAQAVKANKNASILLEELDMERNREENRKAAAARRRERKKKKKLEKKEEKRKLMEGGVELDDKDDSDKDDDSDKEGSEQNIPVSPHQEKEEGDSGIDANSQGSCSSAEAKRSALSEKNKNAKKNKNKKASEAVPIRTNVSPPPTAAQEAPKKKDEVNNNQKAKKEPIKEQNRGVAAIIAPAKPTVEPKPEPIQPQPKSQKKEKEVKQTPVKSEVKKEAPSTPSATSTRNNKEKENVVPKEDTRPNSKKAEPIAKPVTIQDAQPTTASSRKTLTFAPSRNNISDRDDFYMDTDTTYFNSSRNKVNKTVNQHHDESNKSAVKSSAPHGAAKREEGWKEVIRKSSTQQQTTTVTETACKKVQVPTHAISRVIGRAGSNINAIRAATGAHIEVEKQGKNQCDRSITIKGALEATKQAHVLITALIKDPDVDILQMLPKVNNNARSVPPSNVWDKSLGITSSQASPPTVSSSSTIFSSSTKAKPTTTTTTSTVVSSSIKSSTATSTSSTSRSQATAKSVFTLSSNARVANTASTGRAADNVAKKSSVNITSPPSNTSALSVKTSPTENSTITALKNSIKNSAASAAPGTFASKLVSDVKPIGDTASTAVHPSPKHSNVNAHTLPPFGGAAASTEPSIVNKSNKPIVGFGPISSTAEITAIASSAAPVTVSAVSRTVNSSPLCVPLDQLNESNKNIAPIGPPSSGMSGPYPQKMSSAQMMSSSMDSARSHEYSLFDCAAYGNPNQWNRKAMYNAGNGQNYLEDEQMPKADASKAPGYRGAMNSPVNTKQPLSPISQTQRQMSQPNKLYQNHEDKPSQPSMQVNINYAGLKIISGTKNYNNKKSSELVVSCCYC